MAQEDLSVDPRRSRTGNRHVGRLALTGLLAASVSALGIAPVAAQDTSPDARVRRLEAQVRALQRKVFPGGGQTFEPEITPPAATAPPVGPATTTAMTDVLTRMDAIEAQLARVTAQNEQNTNAIAQIQARLGPANAASPDAGSQNNGSPSASPAGSPPPGDGAPGADTQAPDAAPATSGRGPAASPSGPSADRITAVRAIERPRSDDAGDDEYSYGYRLWDAKFFPEAEQQLRLYLQKYPKHPRVSFARNLLGRAYLDDGDPREAAKWFLQNYQADKTGARAPDSLLYLARSMKQAGDSKRACVALGEFGSSYSAEAAGRLKGDYDDTRRGLACK